MTYDNSIDYDNFPTERQIEDWNIHNDHVDGDEDYPEPFGMTDVEADADTFASAGWGTEEDYGYFGEDTYL
jgi:hypothetical protein